MAPIKPSFDRLENHGRLHGDRRSNASAGDLSAPGDHFARIDPLALPPAWLLVAEVSGPSQIEFRET